MDLFFVISLPRTGTTSMCSMASICGLNVIHPPHSIYIRKLHHNEHNFYADTPIFAPEIVQWIIDLSFTDNENYENKIVNKKFIYLERDVDSWFKSWKGNDNFSLKNIHMSMLEQESEVTDWDNYQSFDLQYYQKTFGGLVDEDNYRTLYNAHKQTVIDMVKYTGHDLLLYNFSDGWEPFCEFIEKPIPDQEIPYQNIEKYGDTVIVSV